MSTTPPFKVGSGPTAIPEFCGVCRQHILTDGRGMVISKYWRSKFTPDMRMKKDEVREVYCSPKCSLAAYEARGRQN